MSGGDTGRGAPPPCLTADAGSGAGRSNTEKHCFNAILALSNNDLAKTLYIVQFSSTTLSIVGRPCIFHQIIYCFAIDFQSVRQRLRYLKNR